MKLLKMGKSVKIKHNASSPPKYGETFLLKKLGKEKQTFLGKIYGEMFFMGTNDQIMQGGGKISQIHFAVIWTLWIWEFSPAMVEDTLENKSLPVYRIMEGYILEVNGWEVSKVE